MDRSSSADGKVLAVNYAGDGAGQSYGIGRDEALKVVPTLMGGENVTSLGINGLAISDGALSGIWVNSVASGSPADLGGIEAGDVVTLVEGLIPATDGTMSDYCDILRSHDLDDPISVEVYRAPEDAFLEGTLNTSQTLEVSYSFASELGSEVDNPETTPAGYDSYVTLTDAQNILTVDVPAAWTDVDTQSLWGDGNNVFGVGIWASPDYTAWDTTYTTPGLFFGASAILAQTETVGSLLDDRDYSDGCTYDGRYEYSDNFYTGVYDVWLNCDGGDSMMLDLAAETATGSVLMNVQTVVVNDADLEALDYILNTFVVDEAALTGFVGSDVSSGGTESLGFYDFAYLFDGDCFNTSEASFDQTSYGVEVEAVSCNAPHEGQVYGTYFFSGANYPGDDVVTTTADDYCYNQFSEFVGNSYEQSALDYWFYYPNQGGWESGLTWSMCALVDYGGGMLTGDAYQSGW